MSNAKTVLYITRAHVWGGSITDAHPQIHQWPWDGKNFSEVLSTVVKELSMTSVQLIFGNDVSYVLSLSMDGAVTRDRVMAEAATMIPDTLSPRTSDWKLIGTHNGTQLVQVIAVNAQVLDIVTHAAAEQHIEIESISPLAMVLRDGLRNISETTAVLWSGQESICCIVHNDAIIAVQDVSTECDTRITQLAAFVKERYDVSVQSCVLNEQMKKQAHLPAEWAVTVQPMDPLIFAAGKKNERGKDEDVLEILSVKETAQQEHERAAIKEAGHPIGSFRQRPMYAAIASVTIIVACGVILFFVLF